VVKLHCGHMFCDGCIEEWLRREHTCPLCRAPISTALQGAAKRSAPPFVFCF
jgi:predicted amidophosphoribosyltransferase